MDDSTDGNSPFSDSSRTEAFSDGVLAIVITLLVLELHVPAFDKGGLLDELIAQWSRYLAYLTSYAYVAVFWLNHKAAFRRIRYTDQGVNWANLGVLFMAALIPFPTAVLAEAMHAGNVADKQAAIGLYSLICCGACVSWLWFFSYLRRHSELHEEGVASDFFSGETWRALAGIVLYALAGVAGYLLMPGVSLVIFFLLPIFYGVTSRGLYAVPRVAQRRERRAAEQGDS